MTNTNEAGGIDLHSLTAVIVASHVSNNSVSVSDLPAIIHTVYNSLASLGKVEEVQPDLKPAVPIRSSVKQDYIVCLEDGKKLKVLRRYLRTHYDMSPEDYRAKWGLPNDYPMVAPAYSEKRQALARELGLGRNMGGRKTKQAV